jgi:hypothetical protein
MVLSKSSKQNVKEKQMKLQFNKEKQNTQGVQFRILSRQAEELQQVKFVSS